MVKHSADNCEKLALAIVDAWDMDSLVAFAVAEVSQNLMEDKEDFETAWKEYFPE